MNLVVDLIIDAAYAGNNKRDKLASITCMLEYEPWYRFIRITDIGNVYYDVDIRVHNIINVEVKYKVAHELDDIFAI